MSRIKIVTDSTTWLTPEEAGRLNVGVVPLSVSFGHESLREGIDIDGPAFFRRLAHAEVLPTTSQPPVGEFVRVFEDALKDHDQVLGLFLSGNVSGTAHTAAMAAEMVGGDITVIDTLSASYGVGFCVREAARMVSEGKSLEEIVNHVQGILGSHQVYFVVDSLDHLHRGGRLSSWQATVGSLLQIKPILTLRDGAIVLHEKVRTKRRALENVIDRVRETWEQQGPVRLAIVNGMAETEAASLRDRIRAAFPTIDLAEGEVSPVLGTHVGPGVLGIIFYPLSAALAK